MRRREVTVRNSKRRLKSWQVRKSYVEGAQRQVSRRRTTSPRSKPVAQRMVQTVNNGLVVITDFVPKLKRSLARTWEEVSDVEPCHCPAAILYELRHAWSHCLDTLTCEEYVDLLAFQHERATRFAGKSNRSGETALFGWLFYYCFVRKLPGIARNTSFLLSRGESPRQFDYVVSMNGVSFQIDYQWLARFDDNDDGQNGLFRFTEPWVVNHLPGHAHSATV